MSSHISNKSLYSMRKMPIQSRSKATIEVILEAAARILLADGYEKASTNKIAEISGVSIGSIYEYFPGKEAIFVEIRRREDQRLFDLTMGRPEPQTVKGLVHLHVSIYLEFVRSNLALHAALVNDVPHFAIDPNELPFYREYVPWAIEFLRSHRAELRRDTDVARMGEFITRVTRATIDNYVLHASEQLTDPLIEELIIDLLERFMLKT